MAYINWGAVSAVSTAAGAVFTCGLLGLTWATLLKVRDYTIAAREQVQKTADQLEVSIRPLVTLTVDARNLYLQNLGPGAAINLHFVAHKDADRRADQFETVYTSGKLLNAGDLAHIIWYGRLNQPEASEAAYRVTYESISGARYWSEARWPKGRDFASPIFKTGRE